MGERAWLGDASVYPAYVQVDLGQVMLVTGVRTQGDPLSDSWVSRYTVDLSTDGQSYRTAGGAWSPEGRGTMFAGNDDRSTVVENLLERGGEPAQKVRLMIELYQGSAPALRFELLVCPLPPVAEQQLDSCGAVGMYEGGELADSAWSASTVHSHCPLAKLRLHSTHAWCADDGDATPWVAVDLGRVRVVRGLWTQGRADYGQWVERFRLAFRSSAGDPWEEQMREYDANNDQHSVVYTRLRAPVQARYVRVDVTQSNQWASMRLDIDACDVRASGSCDARNNMPVCTCDEPELVGARCNVPRRSGSCAAAAARGEVTCLNGGKCGENPAYSALLAQLGRGDLTLDELALSKELPYSCACLGGWEGDRCEVIAAGSPCASMDCGALGDCEEHGREAFGEPKVEEDFIVRGDVTALTGTCKCVQHVSGPACDVVGDVCAASDEVPCVNGGTCVPLDAATATRHRLFRCDCPDPFTGPRCERLNPCKVDGVCGNRGTCSLDATNAQSPLLAALGVLATPDEQRDIDVPPHTCTCDPGWEGSRCQFAVCPVDALCFNGASCHVDQSDPRGYTCECAPGFEGASCNVALDWCGDGHGAGAGPQADVCPRSSGRCVTGAVLLGMQTACSCFPGRSGEQCEVDERVEHAYEACLEVADEPNAGTALDVEVHFYTDYDEFGSFRVEDGVTGGGGVVAGAWPATPGARGPALELLRGREYCGRLMLKIESVDELRFAQVRLVGGGTDSFAVASISVVRADDGGAGSGDDDAERAVAHWTVRVQPRRSPKRPFALVSDKQQPFNATVVA